MCDYEVIRHGPVRLVRPSPFLSSSGCHWLVTMCLCLIDCEMVCCCTAVLHLRPLEVIDWFGHVECSHLVCSNFFFHCQWIACVGWRIVTVSCSKGKHYSFPEMKLAFFIANMGKVILLSEWLKKKSKMTKILWSEELLKLHFRCSCYHGANWILFYYFAMSTYGEKIHAAFSWSEKFSTSLKDFIIFLNSAFYLYFLFYIA